MMTNKIAAAAALAVLSLGLSACGNQEEEAKTSMSESFQQEDVGGMDVDEDQADCMAGDIVDGVGVDQLKEYEILDDDGSVNDNVEDARLSEEDADTVSAALVDCIGAESIVEEQVIQDQMTDDQQECVRETMGEEQLKALISVGFQGADQSDEAVQQLQEDMAACMKK
jgi:hypothetical protein